MNAQEFKTLFDRIQYGRTTREDRKVYTTYVELLSECVNEAYTDERRTTICCIDAEIHHRPDNDSSYISATYATSYWNLGAVVGSRAAHIMSATFCDGTNKVLITDHPGDLWIAGMKQPKWNTAPWAMDAILVLAGKNVVICSRCRYPYELCEHSKKDKAALLCL